MKVYGLIGYPLAHSFSKKYFTEKFEKVTIEHYEANIPVYKCKMRDWAFLVTPKHDEKYFRKIINDCYEKTGESEFETVK